MDLRGSKWNWHNQMLEAGIHYLDAGTSGGMKAHGMEPVYVGGDHKAWEVAEPLFRDTAVENGYLYAGEAGSGRF